MNEQGIYYFHEGSTCKAYELLGAHYTPTATIFRVWAPHAVRVSVIGDFNNWDKEIHYMHKLTKEGIYEIIINGDLEYASYKYAIETSDGHILEKADPYAIHSELRPHTASKVYNLNNYKFNDEAWLLKRKEKNTYQTPLNIYELHLGSWRKYKDNNYFNYRDIAQELCDYVKTMGYTHIELLPLAEHPYDPSWGYQVTGFYSVTSRYGTPDDFKAFVDICHQNDLGVILDFVPAHFTKDAFGLIEFDGTCLYEPVDEFKKENKGWGTRCFDFAKNEVQSFLISAACFYADVYHIDGLRVDAVSSILYLDYGRNAGEWIPNREGNNLNLEGIAFIKKMNAKMKEFDPSVIMIAEESTAFARVTYPVSQQGLGFDYKWNMGWMNDSLKYLSTDPYFKHTIHHLITFGLTYIFSEHYILPISHDEVVHLKKSLIEKCPGNYNEKFAGVRLFMTYMMTHPGKKLLFMGSEFGQFNEWNEQKELDWSCLGYERHQQLKYYIEKLNRLYKNCRALYDDTLYWQGFSWIAANDASANVFIYERCYEEEKIIVILNFAFKSWYKYQFKAKNGRYKIILCSQDNKYGGNLSLEDDIIDVKNNIMEMDIPACCGIIIKKEN